MFGIGLALNISKTSISPESSQPLKSSDNKTVHQGVLILPFNVDALDNSQKWLRFGAMEGLINRISPNQHVTVFLLEDTIEILNRLPVTDKNDVERIFAKSGASTILKTSISGVPGDYNVVYSVFTPKSVVTKSIHIKDVNSGVEKLAAVFEQPVVAATNIDTQSINNKFQNDLITKAIQFLEIQDRRSALAFLESAVVNDGNNVFALYLLSKVALDIGDFQRTLDVVNVALTNKTSPALAQYKNRLMYLKGSALVVKRELIEAEQVLLQAEQGSKANRDWLYYSYSQSMLGKVSLLKKDFDSAYGYLSAALQYQEVLQCPMGVAQAHIDFADFYLLKNDKDKAMNNYQVAKKMIVEQKLKQAEPLLTYIEERFAQTQE